MRVYSIFECVINYLARVNLAEFICVNRLFIERRDCIDAERLKLRDDLLNCQCRGFNYIRDLDISLDLLFFLSELELYRRLRLIARSVENIDLLMI